MVFADSWLLWVLGPVAAGWLLLWWLGPALRSRWAPRGRGSVSQATLAFSSLQHLARLKPSRTLVMRRLSQGLRIVTVALILLAVARPQTGQRHTQVRTEGIDIVLVMDTSGSMRALDFDAERAIQKRRNRLEVARDVVEEFVEGRENDQIGLVVFGEHAFTQCPLTLDHGIVATFLDRLEIGMAGDATAIGSGIGTAVKRLKDSTGESQVVILLTDGRSNAGAIGPIRAADIAKALGVKIYAIGVGTRGQAPFLVESVFGRQVVHQDVEIDEETLETVASTTGGRYFRAEDTGSLEAIYDEIDKLEKTEITTSSYMEWNERFRLFVFPAIGTLLLEMLLLGTRFRKLP